MKQSERNRLVEAHAKALCSEHIAWGRVLAAESVFIAAEKALKKALAAHSDKAGKLTDAFEALRQYEESRESKR